MGNRDADTWMGGPQDAFRTTLWTVVINAKDPASPERRAALQKLIETYWKPLYLFVRRKGQNSETAKDTVQSFFTTLLEKDLLQYLQPGRAKFRTFLLLALKHHMSDRVDHDTAIKRGGGKHAFSMDFSGAEKDVAEADSPDQIFRREWGLQVLQQALALLKADYATADRAREFEQLRNHLGPASNERHSYTDMGAALGLTEGEVRHRVSRARAAYREKVLDIIRAYSEGPEQVQEELHDLFSALS